MAEFARRGLVQGRVFALDGGGLGKYPQLVSLTSASTERPFIAAWRLLEGDAPEKGKEAAMTRSLLEQLRAWGIENKLLLVDGLYADGAFLAWCKYALEIDVLVPIPRDRALHRDLEQQAVGGLRSFSVTADGNPAEPLRQRVERRPGRGRTRIAGQGKSTDDLSVGMADGPVAARGDAPCGVHEPGSLPPYSAATSAGVSSRS